MVCANKGNTMVADAPAPYITRSSPATHDYIDGLVQERRNSSALAVELYLSCIIPSI